MPYIKNDDREEFDKLIPQLVEYIRAKGDLNYVVCEIIGQLCLRDGIGYTTISNWIDTLPDAEYELRRRILDPYEDLKIAENGDVPSLTKVLEAMR